eukprot:Nk52_evm32s2568 gene=Nk52_evmTU32s2568
MGLFDQLLVVGGDKKRGRQRKYESKSTADLTAEKSQLKDGIVKDDEKAVVLDKRLEQANLVLQTSLDFEKKQYEKFKTFSNRAFNARTRRLSIFQKNADDDESERTSVSDPSMRSAEQGGSKKNGCSNLQAYYKASRKGASILDTDLPGQPSQIQRYSSGQGSTKAMLKEKKKKKEQKRQQAKEKKEKEKGLRDYLERRNAVILTTDTISLLQQEQNKSPLESCLSTSRASLHRPAETGMSRNSSNASLHKELNGRNLCTNYSSRSSNISIYTDSSVSTHRSSKSSLPRLTPATSSNLGSTNRCNTSESADFGKESSLNMLSCSIDTVHEVSSGAIQNEDSSETLESYEKDNLCIEEESGDDECIVQKNEPMTAKEASLKNLKARAKTVDDKEVRLDPSKLGYPYNVTSYQNSKAKLCDMQKSMSNIKNTTEVKRKASLFYERSSMTGSNVSPRGSVVNESNRKSSKKGYALDEPIFITESVKSKSRPNSRNLEAINDEIKDVRKRAVRLNVTNFS